jgi:hypothetical protein
MRRHSDGFTHGEPAVPDPSVTMMASPLAATAMPSVLGGSSTGSSTGGLSSVRSQ